MDKVQYLNSKKVYCIIILYTVFNFLIFMLLYVGNILLFHQFPKQYGSLAEALKHVQRAAECGSVN